MLRTMTGHVSAGRLHGLRAGLGTVLGPIEVTREFVVVTGPPVARGVVVGYARSDELDADALLAMVQRGPRSVTEAGLVFGLQAPVWQRLQLLFGSPQEGRS